MREKLRINNLLFLKEDRNTKNDTEPRQERLCVQACEEMIAVKTIKFLGFQDEKSGKLIGWEFLLQTSEKKKQKRVQ